ncbi:hypothetical protein MPRM_27160 [Mycobacterium parmense]|uniref:DUF732 domain-containing protein n=3 Tax=Mycobacterium parmense TaxID=185642 RepID=A0A7I7YU88_9MYCO|nr:hypothetical protein MPRM_27160 [Mycobacterium parmense]
MRCKTRVRAAVAALVLALAVLGSGHARADPKSFCSDGQTDCRRDVPGYLSMLASAGVHGNSDQTLVIVGDRVCGDLERGTPSAVVAAGLRQTNPSMTLLAGNAAVDAALVDLCPQLMRTDNREPVLLPLQQRR